MFQSQLGVWSCKKKPQIKMELESIGPWVLSLMRAPPHKNHMLWCLNTNLKTLSGWDLKSYLEDSATKSGETLGLKVEKTKFNSRIDNHMECLNANFQFT